MDIGAPPQEHSPSSMKRLFQPIIAWHQTIIDKLAPHRALRWIIAIVLLALYVMRVYYLQGFHIISYALAIYMLNLFIASITPKIDPSLADVYDESPTLPRTEGGEFRPFIPVLLEAKFWLSTVRAITVAFCCTFFRVLDIPVFWPILVFYFCMLFVLMMKRQIKHMIKYRYVPFQYGKPKHTDSAGSNATKKVSQPSSSTVIVS